MQEATAQRKREMEAADTDEEREQVAERWREQGNLKIQLLESLGLSAGILVNKSWFC